MVEESVLFEFRRKLSVVDQHGFNGLALLQRQTIYLPLDFPIRRRPDTTTNELRFFLQSAESLSMYSTRPMNFMRV